jgi:creatinine amidohydrolase
MAGKLNKYCEMNWKQFAEFVSKTPFALLPVGALEQHGPHLPFNTDVIIAEYMAEKIAEQTGFLLLPSLQYTPSFSLRRYPGTIRLEDDTFSNQICEIARSLDFHGLKYIYLIIGHIGAINACKKAERRMIVSENNIRLVNIAIPGLNEAIKKFCTAPRWHPVFAHADEYETSAILAIRPDLVDMSKAVKEYPPKNKLMGNISIAWDEFCESGVIGDATVATTEKGKKILDHMISRSIEIIEYHQSQMENEDS